MSRVVYGDDNEGFPGQWALWDANMRRALNGKRGRKALAELREALLMLPEKRLVAGAISTVALAREAAEMPDTKPGWRFDLNEEPPQVPNTIKQEDLEKCEREGLGVCAVGAYLARKRVLKTGGTMEEAMAALPSSADSDGYDMSETIAEGEAAGLTRHVAWFLAERNDEVYSECTPEKRYEKFLAWLDHELGVSA